MCFMANQFARKFRIFGQLNRIFRQYVLYLSRKSSNKSVKWTKRPFPKEKSGKGQRKLEVGHRSYSTLIKKFSGSLATLVPT